MYSAPERIKKIASHLGITEGKLAKELGYSREQVIYDITKGKTKNISSGLAKKIKSSFPQFNIIWILTGEGDMLIDNKPVASYTKGVPYYNVDFLGGFDLVYNDQTANPDYLIDFELYNEADCWCNITGRSMEPEINSGDIIALKELKDWRDFIIYGEVYGIITDEMRTVKRVTGSERQDCFRLIPTNKSAEYKPQDIPINLIRKVYRVLGVMKRL